MAVDTGPKLANMTQLAIAIVSAQVAKKKKKKISANSRILELGWILKTHLILHRSKVRNR